VTRRVTIWVSDTLQRASVSLANWPRTMGPHQLRMAGRFADGRWVALAANDLDLSTQADRLIIDTPFVVVGLADAPPVRLLTLPTRRRISVFSPSEGWNIASLFEIAPAQFAVCDSGLLVVDTAGVRTYDRSGTLMTNRPLAVARSPRAPGSDADRRLRRLLIDDSYPWAKASTLQQLRSWYDAVDSTLLMPTIDSHGLVWYVAPPHDSLHTWVFTAQAEPRARIRGNPRIVHAAGARVVTATWDDTVVANRYRLQAPRPPVHTSTDGALGYCNPAITF
jgi:hypothetical protein